MENDQRPGCGGLLRLFYGGDGAYAFVMRVVDDLPRSAEVMLPGEALIRRDLVHYGVGLSGNVHQRSGWMTLTSQRVLVTEMNEPLWFRARRLLLYQRQLKVPPPRFQVRLDRIRRVWRWKPEFSAPVFLQTTDGNGISYFLVENRMPWSRALPVAQQREHLDSLEAALEAFGRLQ